MEGQCSEPRLSIAGKLEHGEVVALQNDLQLTLSVVWLAERYRSALWQALKLHEAR